MRYDDLDLKQPVESSSYKEDSAFIIKQMKAILDKQIEKHDNKIIINTNLRMGLPLENINKIAGPMIEAWVGEVFSGIRDNLNNPYSLINVEAQERLGVADIILQFKKNDSAITGNIDGHVIEIQTSSTGYYVYWYEWGTGSGATAVEFPTWTATNAQDDIIWHNGSFKLAFHSIQFVWKASVLW